jgi:hypothetical protein
MSPATPGALAASTFAEGDQLIAQCVPSRTPEGTRNDQSISSLTVGDIQGESVSVTVNHYHGDVTTQTQTQTRTVQQTTWTQVENHPVYIPSYGSSGGAPPSSEGGAFRLLILFAAFIFVLVWAYRSLVNPAPTTVIVAPAAGPAERPMPRTFLDYVESQGQ